MSAPPRVGPNARPQMLPEFIQVMASVRRSPGTMRSQVAFAVMKNGA